MSTELMRLAKERAREIVESGQEHELIALVETDAGVVPVMFANVPKPAFKAVFTGLLRRLHAAGYVMVMEAWMTESRRPLEEGLAVSDLPLDDRSEVLVVTCVRREEAPVMEYAIIDRRPEGRRLRPWQKLEGGSMQGRMMVTEW